MQNSQAPERKRATGQTLDVHSIFHTIQGEGPFSGHSATFIRLAGCNLICPACDTDYTSKRQDVDIIQIVRCVNAITPPRPQSLIVITGGEPFRQDISSLCQALISSGYVVQIETNGTLPPSPNLRNDVTIVCSPKGGRVSAELQKRISAYKYVIDAKNVSPEDGLPTSVLGTGTSPARPHFGFKGPVYVTPMDESVYAGPGCIESSAPNFDNAQAAAAACLKHGYILNLQIHKLAGLP